MEVDNQDFVINNDPSSEREKSSSPTPQPELKTPSAVRSKEINDAMEGDLEHSGDETQSEHADEPSDENPMSPLEPYNWDDLDKRFQDMVKERDDVEEKLKGEFNELVEFFQIWAATSKTHEVDCSVKSLSRRMRHVQKSEQDLENLKQHHTNVVQAFQIALQLLQRTV